MINQSQVNNLNIQGKNTLRDQTQNNLSESWSNSYTSDSINNFILNSNLDNSNSIK